MAIRCSRVDALIGLFSPRLIIFRHSRRINRAGRSLIRRLLERDRTRRLGCMIGGVKDIKEHRWFENISWTDVIEQRIPVRRDSSVPSARSSVSSASFVSHRFDLRSIIQVIRRTSNYSVKNCFKLLFVHQKKSICFTNFETFIFCRRSFSFSN